MVRETREIDAVPSERSDLLHGRRANHYALRLVPGLALRFAEHRGQRAADNIDELFINRRRRREPEHPARAQGARHPVCERDAAWLMEGKPLAFAKEPAEIGRASCRERVCQYV